MYWDVKSGSLLRSTRDTVEADTDWATWNCVLGFPVMGIWPRDTDGTDVNRWVVPGSCLLWRLVRPCSDALAGLAASTGLRMGSCW
jgi:hypothetical protein